MTGHEWWYARIYPTAPSAMDTAAAGAARWARSTARDIGAGCWYFIRYLDPTGVHVRLRLRAHPDALDTLAGRSVALHELTAEPAPAEHQRLVPDVSRIEATGPAGIRLGVYEPELDKYGADHLADAERSFQASSELMVDLDVTAKPATGARAALAVHLMRHAAHAVLTTAELPGFWSHHRNFWGRGLRQLELSRQTLSEHLTTLNRAVEQNPPTAAELERLRGWSEDLARVIHAADPARRTHLFFHHLHMSVNRLGYLPPEEALLGLVASSGGPR